MGPSDHALLGGKLAQGNEPKAEAASKKEASYKAQIQKSAMAYLENGGQWTKHALYLSRTPNMDVWVTRTGLVFDYHKTGKVQKTKTRTGHVVHMNFVGAKAKGSVGKDKTPAVTQFIKPGSFKNTITAKSYAEALVDDLYPGVDLRAYTEESRPRYDLIVEPGANPNSISFKLDGAKDLKVLPDGSLQFTTSLGVVQQRDLVAYQTIDGQKKEVEADFSVNKGKVSFKLGSYDKSLPLTIDPIVYGSYYGGDTGIDEVRAITSDADAGVYLTGATQAPDFPVLFGPYSFNLTGTSDTFLAKLRGDVYVHEYSAYIGGSGLETGKFIHANAAGNSIWIAGMTTSANFPGVGGGSFRSAIVGTMDMFLIRFSSDPITVLAPVYSTYFGSTNAADVEEIKGFSVGNVTGDVFIAGDTTGNLPSAVNADPAAGANRTAFVTRLNNTGQSIVYSRYHGGTANQRSGLFGVFIPSLPGEGHTGQSATANPTSAITGNALALDGDENAYLTGTVVFTGNQNTDTATPAYPTTAGSFNRILRNNDIFVAKFDSTGSVIYSSLLGGQNTEIGSGVAVDDAGNAYVTGITTSFDFPRTPGTFGQVFNANPVVIATKISPDGSELVYSTNLRTTGLVCPTGIAVNQRGFAFITGVVDVGITFPVPPADPNVPNSHTTGTIQVQDPLRTANTFPGTGDLPATDGFINVLDSAAETLLFGTYIGGQLDEIVFAPYTDRIGDVWVMGYSDSGRRYQRVSSTGTPTTFDVTSTGLDAAFITPLAFKPNIQPKSVPTVFSAVPYGVRESPFTAPSTIGGVERWRDGFLLRFRLQVPFVQSVTLNPTAIAGGLGQKTTGTVTLGEAAPAEGVTVNITVSNTAAASFDGAGSGVTTVTIPGGQTTGTFEITSHPVIDPTNVLVRAEFLGSFKEANLSVNPWLSSLTVNPQTVVGGNVSTGRVTLFRTATEDVTVALSSDNPTLASVPATVVVSAGQQSATFPIDTVGVTSLQSANISAAFLGRSRVQTLNVKPATIASLAFNPNRIAGGSKSTGTVTLDGDASTGGVTVNISVITNPGNISAFPATVTVPEGSNSATFEVTANLVGSNTFSVFRASHNGTNRDATLLIDNITLSTFTINPNTTEGGKNISATVSINQPAPAGGAAITLSSVPGTHVILPDEDPVTAGNQIFVPESGTSRTFTIGTRTTIAQVIEQISASRGGAPITRQLTINPLDFTFTIAPSSIRGGTNATMTITLSGPAPAGGLTVNVTKATIDPPAGDQSAAATVNGGNPVTFAAGETTKQWTISTVGVSSTDKVRFTAQIGPTVRTADLEIRATQLVSISFVPSTVRGLRTTNMILTLDGPAPAGGATVSLTKSGLQSSALNIPVMVTIPEGQTTFSQTVTTNKVSRSIAVFVDAHYGGVTRNTTVVITR